MNNEVTISLSAFVIHQFPMNNHTTSLSVHLEQLILDKNNPRFAELYSGSASEEDLIEYLLYTEAAEEIAKAITSAGEFYPDEPLWVLKVYDKYLVKDGNRRCAAAKALLTPTKYQLSLTKFRLDSLPILIFDDEAYLDRRINEKHGSSLFREWERIAKSLQIYSLYTSVGSIDVVKELDSQPGPFLKLASFYYKAVSIGGENLKKLLRRGRGKTGGKTIVFERLFKYSEQCGYDFKSKPSYEINIFDEDLFSRYILATVKFLEDHPDTTHKTVDAQGGGFLKNLKEYGFNTEPDEVDGWKEKTEENKSKSERKNEEGNKTDTGKCPPTKTNPPKKWNVKQRPALKRKQLPPTLLGLIKECYDIDENIFPNAKIALSRMAFECTLKYVVENTAYNSKNLSTFHHFEKAYFLKTGGSRQYTNFGTLKAKFTELIRSTGVKKAFEDFDLDRPHQIIHNHNVSALRHDAKTLSDNLMVLLEFMLQEESVLLSSLDSTKF